MEVRFRNSVLHAPLTERTSMEPVYASLSHDDGKWYVYNWDHSVAAGPFRDEDAARDHAWWMCWQLVKGQTP